MITESFEDSTLNTLIKQQHYENLIKRVNSVEGAISVCNELKIDISDLLLEEPKTKQFIAFKELQIIAKALNEGWKPNWNDTNEYKYFNWFNMINGSFSYYYTGCNDSYADVPSTLFFKTHELAEYAGRTFINLYKDYLVM